MAVDNPQLAPQQPAPTIKVEEKYKPEDYTGPSQFVHLHNHTIFSTLDGVATPEQYAEQCKERGYPAMSATEHGHMASVPDMYLAFKKAKVKYIPGCFLPLQPIYTTGGVKSFVDVKPGDMVLTHKAHIHRVLNLQIRQYDGDILRIKAWGVEDQVCTPEHPLLVREVTRTEVKKGVWEDNVTCEFRRADELFREKYWRTYATKRSQDRSNKRRYRFYLCVPRLPVNEYTSIDLVDKIFPPGVSVEPLLDPERGLITSAIYTAKGYRTTVVVNLPVFLDMDEELLWIMGLWLAEGSALNGGPHFSLAADEYHFYERIAAYFARFDIKTSFRMRDGSGESRPRQAMDVQVYSNFFGRLFVNLFGTGFGKKKIPDVWLHRLNREQAKSLLNGLYDGDAKCGEQRSYLKLANRTLVWQARLLMTKLDIPQYSAVTELPGVDGRQTSYTIRRRETGHFYYDYDDEYIYLPVYAVEKDRYSGEVYNMEVEGDNSYYTGVAVHNCEIYYNDWEPIRQDIERRGHKVRSPEWRRQNAELAARIVRNRHLTVLCKNKTGFENLVKLTTQAYGTGLFGVSQRQFNRIWFEKLCEYKEGLIILSGCLNGPVCHELRYKELKDREGNVIATRDRKTRLDEAVKYIKKFKEVFGEDYYMELQMPGVEDDAWVFRTLVMLADNFKIPLVLANDCWNPEVPVQTASGSKKLCELRPGELVWTHRGRLRQVMQVGKRRVRPGEAIYGYLGSKAIQCTGNHKLLARHFAGGPIAFVEVGDLAPDAEIAVSRVNLPADDLKTIRVSDYLVGPRLSVRGGFVYPIGGKTINPIPDILEVTDDLLWTMGMYLSEGASDGYRLTFGHHEDEPHLFNRLISFFSGFGFNPNVRHIDVSGRGVRTRVCSSGFSYLFADLMGNGSHRKRLPAFWTRLSARQLLVMLRGYFDGDGCRARRSFFTVSIQLFTDLVQAFAAVGLGVTPSLRPAKQMVIKSKKRGSIQTFRREGYIGSIGKIGLRTLGYNIAYDATKVRRKWVLEGETIWIKNPFRRIESDIDEVWCIQVEDDSSFLVGVTSSNCHYLTRKDFLLQKVMMAIAQDTSVYSDDLFHVNSDEQYMKTRGELWARFKNYPYSKGIPDSVFETMCDNTLIVADKVKPFDFDPDPKIPNIPDADGELCRLVAIRLKELGLDKCVDKFIIDGKEVTYVDQVKIELKRFIDKGFSSYFLITRDLVQHGRKQGWPFSPRGSAGGSLVCYLLGIHTLDPLLWGLSFDRFLSPSRGGYMLNLAMGEER